MDGDTNLFKFTNTIFLKFRPIQLINKLTNFILNFYYYHNYLLSIFFITSYYLYIPIFTTPNITYFSNHETNTNWFNYYPFLYQIIKIIILYLNNTILSFFTPNFYPFFHTTNAPSISLFFIIYHYFYICTHYPNYYLSFLKTLTLYIYNFIRNLFKLSPTQ